MNHDGMGANENAPSTCADRNLLFGIIALQVNFITREALVAAFDAWTRDKSRTLAEILQSQGALPSDVREILDRLVGKFIEKHEGDAQKTLSALSPVPQVRAALDRFNDPDLEASLGHVGITISDDPNLTETLSFTQGPSLGRFRILRPHAKGGLGQVSVALDQDLNREVALKEIQPRHADDPLSRERFVLEAEITGGLEHPGIVPVYALGQSPDGRPFYAMRFIKGDSLREAIDAFHRPDSPNRKDIASRRLALRQLLGRFIDVCNAMEYAHSRGVLHRDLKPGNIMVGKHGETLVVDWGLAKTGTKGHETEQKAIGPTHERTLRPQLGSGSSPTQIGTIIGTPAYMSPEQASGQMDLGVASDIYSLGSTLYVLLTGKKPYEANDLVEVLALVRKGQFVPPKLVNPEIPAPLDAICRKAMAFEPQARYATALEFAVDIEHWLADTSVSAYPEPWWSRLGRWARHHRVAVASAAVCLICAVLALSVSTVLISAEQRRTEAQKLRALENYRISREQSFNIIKLIESSEPEFARLPILHERRAELLETASNACRKFLRQEPNDVELIQRSAGIYRYSANFHRLIYEHDLALPLYQEAISLQRRLLGELTNADQQIRLCDVLRDFSGSQKDQGRLQDATNSLNEALVIAEVLWKSEPERPAYRRELALLLVNRALLQERNSEAGTSEPPLAMLKRATDLLRELVEGSAERRHPYDPLLLAAVLNQSAIQEREAGNHDGALSAHAEAVKLLKELFDAKLKDVNEADATHFRAECQIEQCRTWAKIDKPKYLTSAEANAGLAVNKLFELARDYPKLPAYRESLAKAFLLRGQIRLQGKNFAGAREHLQSARELLNALIENYSSLPSLRGELGATLTGLGEIAKQLKDEDEMKWFELAETELNVARKQSPDDIQWKRLSNELERARQPEPKNNQGAPGSEM